MYARNFNSLLIFTLVVLGSTAVNAQTVPPAPHSSTEIILATVSPNEPFEKYFPNHEDKEHPKHLIFEGFFQNLDPQRGSAGDFWFDWRDPDGTEHTSPVVPIDLGPLETLTVGLAGTPDGKPAITFTIPYCPPQVSIHYHNGGPSEAVLIQGRFTHTCIPEPSSMLLAGLSLAGIGVVALRRRRA